MSKVQFRAAVSDMVNGCVVAVLIEGEQFGQLAVHEEVTRDVSPRYWTVSHIETGRALAWFAAEENAVVFAAALADVDMSAFYRRYVKSRKLPRWFRARLRNACQDTDAFRPGPIIFDPAIDVASLPFQCQEPT